MRSLSLVVVFAVSIWTHGAFAAVRETPKLLKLVNRAHDSIVSLHIAAVGTADFREVYLGEPLRGGGDSATVEIPAAHCRYDFRFAFRNGRRLVYEDVDVCRITGLRIAPLPPSDGSRRLAH